MKKWLGVGSLLIATGLILMVNLNAKGKKSLSSLSTNQPAPDFKLVDTNGKSHSLSDYKEKYVVLEWINHGCPYVKKHYDSGNMQALQKETAGKDVVWLSICSSAEGKQGHFSPKEWSEITQEKSATPTAVLLDPEGSVGQMYGAKTTPHMYIVNPEGLLVYQGAIDDKPTAYKEDVNGAKNYVRAALGDALAGKMVQVSDTQPYGCSVKYK